MAMTLEERIRCAVEATGLDVKTIAKRCNVTAQAVYAWLSGHNLKPENLFVLADLAGFEARWIAIEKGPQTSIHRNKHITEVIDVMAIMPEMVRAEAQKHVERLAYFAIRLTHDSLGSLRAEPYPGDRRLTIDRRISGDRRVTVDRRLMPFKPHLPGDTIGFQKVDDPGPPPASPKPPPKPAPRNAAGKRKK